MSSFFPQIIDEQTNSMRLTDVVKSSDIESIEPSPQKYLKINNEPTIEKKLDPIIQPIKLQEQIIQRKQEQKLKINPKLQFKSLKLYVTQAIIESEEIKFNYENQYK